MTSKERISAAFAKKPTDRIPVNHRGFSSKIASYILQREAFVGGGIQRWREAKSLYEGWHDEFLERSFRDAVEISRVTGQDMLRPVYWRMPRKPTRKVDECTYLYEYGPESDWTVLHYDPPSEGANSYPYQKKDRTLDDLKKKEKLAGKAVAGYQPGEADYTEYVKAQKLYGEEKVVEIGAGGIGIPHDEQTGLWFQAMLLDPGLVKALIRRQVESAREIIPFLSGFGFRYFLGGGDFASKQGPMYSPRLFREFILPGLKEIAEICHRCNGRYLFASDGNLWPVADMLFGESGVDGYYEVDRKAGMDLKMLREKYPDLTLVGNISSWTLSQGSPEAVRNEVLDCLEAASRYNGIIAGVSNYFLPETPPENVDMLLKTIDENR